MFRNSSITPELRANQLLTMSEEAKSAFYELVEPSIAASLNREELHSRVKAALSNIAARKMLPYNNHELALLSHQLVDEMVGIGPIQPLLEDPTVSDILVNGPDTVYVERQGKLEKTDIRFRDSKHVLNVAQRIVNAIGRRVDESNPMVDARLKDGSRVNVIAPPLALHGTCISIRKFPASKMMLEHLVSKESMSPEMAEFLAIATHCRCNILISGGTGSGKTTLLNALSRHISEDERILTIEDAAELSLAQPHWVPLETRNASTEGNGEVSVRDLVKNALRMRPDRIVLGEVRGAEAFDMLQAMNTGHDGSLCTLHANNPQDAIVRLTNMLQMGGERLSDTIIRSQIVSAIDVVVQLERMRDGHRRVTAISEVVGSKDEHIELSPIFNFELCRADKHQLYGQFKAFKVSESLLEKASHFAMEDEMQKSVESK
ncbi:MULTISPECIES: CpaF family protein [Vibrio]|uniref:Pilus assembly protein CpaF n=2 Tax=Vibrio TaxID=662 RepID=A0A0A5HS07_PHOS4|nr:MULTISPECIES: CpaF family protein [Vibrio]KGY08347.1 pilus assembly protein CpaF [Vibrio sinaloensis]KHD25210.1 pilus assembly protein CpaF [Vibrio caribbeanicus]